MVELYELKLMSTETKCWPPDLDEHVAQLDFGASIMDDGDGQSVLASIMADPSIISTDSLDMDILRARCENNKNNDYKLTFEDSGQWTTSGIGGSFTTTNTTESPPTPQTRRFLKLLHRESLQNDWDNQNFSLQLLEKLNNRNAADEEFGDCGTLRWKNNNNLLLDEVLNNNGNRDGSLQVDFGGLTTWGRIGNTAEQEQQPPFDADKFSSSPELNRNRQEKYKVFVKGNSSPTVAQSNSKDAGQKFQGGHTTERLKLGSLVSATEAEETDQQQSPMVDIPFEEYSEVYLGNGRYIDMNENEIGYVPPASTAAIQRHEKQQPPQVEIREKRNWRSETAGMSPKSSRTFADFSASRTAPDLKFIALAHEVPSICSSSPSTNDLLKRAKAESSFSNMLECCTNSEKILSAEADNEESPDSGLGTSSSEGPSHIEDWQSLSVLLPRHVVAACSFFKSNSFLLTGSSTNNIESRCPPPRSFTSPGIRQLSRCEKHHGRPATACSDCLGGSSVEVVSRSLLLTNHQQQQQSNTLSTTRRTAQRLHAKELALVGLPVYDQKRGLIECVVEGVAEIIRGGSSVVLVTALEKLLSDDLKRGVLPWEVIRRLTGQGPVTASVFQLIEELEAGEKPANSRVKHFFQGLIGLHSVDGWFSYIVLKEGTLRQFYVDTSFFIGPQTTYRSLFARFMESLELLSVFNQCGKNQKRYQQQKRRQQQQPMVAASIDCGNSSAAKVPSDSRVPKSSSVPTKLARNFDQGIGKEKAQAAEVTSKIPTIYEPESKFGTALARPSKIPVLRSRSKSTSMRSSNAR